MQGVNLKNERIGIIKKNKYRSLMQVIKYESNKNILVRFLDNGNVVQTSWKVFCEGKVKNVFDKSVFNVGFIGEGKYKVTENSITTPHYRVWHSLIRRVHDTKFLEKNPAYKNCTITDSWYNFQNFAKWYDANHYEVKNETVELDKDILVKGNKLYSPDTCVFAPKRINLLFTKKDSHRGDLPVGVVFKKTSGKYTAQCNDGKGNSIRIGHYDTLEKAFLSYKNYKESLIKEIAEQYACSIPINLYEALLNYKVEITD